MQWGWLPARVFSAPAQAAADGAGAARCTLPPSVPALGRFICVSRLPLRPPPSGERGCTQRARLASVSKSWRREQRAPGPAVMRCHGDWGLHISRHTALCQQPLQRRGAAPAGGRPTQRRASTLQCTSGRSLPHRLLLPHRLPTQAQPQQNCAQPTAAGHQPAAPQHAHRRSAQPAAHSSERSCRASTWGYIKLSA